jgi:hypothetical protein
MWWRYKIKHQNENSKTTYKKGKNDKREWRGCGIEGENGCFLGDKRFYYSAGEGEGVLKKARGNRHLAIGRRERKQGARSSEF